MKENPPMGAELVTLPSIVRVFLDVRDMSLIERVNCRSRGEMTRLVLPSKLRIASYILVTDRSTSCPELPYPMLPCPDRKIEESLMLIIAPPWAPEPAS